MCLGPARASSMSDDKVLESSHILSLHTPLFIDGHELNLMPVNSAARMTLVRRRDA